MLPSLLRRKKSLSIHEIAIGVAALCGVIGLIWLTARLLRAGGVGQTSPNARLRLVQSLALDPRRRVQLITIDGREIVVLTGGPNDLVLMGPADATRGDVA